MILLLLALAFAFAIRMVSHLQEMLMINSHQQMKRLDLNLFKDFFVHIVGTHIFQLRDDLREN